MKKLLAVFIAVSFFASSSFSALKNEKAFALTGSFALLNVGTRLQYSITLVKINIRAGAEYWFNKHFALGADLGLVRQGVDNYGFTFDKVISTDSSKTSFLISPGISVTGALSAMSVFVPYIDLRIGFTTGVEIPPIPSIVPAIGTLIAFNDWVALDLCARIHFLPQNYLGFSFGAVGVRVIL
ncbi:MAG: hypothetical protein KC505_09070 [Myxococcales bacterium]|nr:hypothetical protein [Myxococcales bacterium]USN51662.1 MAG: hypothetical protein H6731_04430 [Myxococcales bacterium]